MVEHEVKIVEEAIAALDKYYDLYNKSRNGLSLIEASILMRTLLPSDHALRKRNLMSEYEAGQLATFKKEYTTKKKHSDAYATEALW